MDFKKYLFLVLSKWYLFVIFIPTSYFLASQVIKYTEPIYMVNGKLMISTEQSTLGRNVGGLDLFNEDQNFYNQISILKSYDLVYKTLSQLDFGISYQQLGDVRNVELYKQSPFTVKIDSGSFQLAEIPFTVTLLSGNEYLIEAKGGAPIYDVNANTVEGRVPNYLLNKKMKFGERYADKYVAFTLYLTDPNINPEIKYTFVLKNKINLTQTYKNRLSVEPDKLGSSVVVLALTGPVQRKDIDFINKHMEVFIQSSLEDKDEITINTIRFIDDQLKQISDNLETVEDQRESFMKIKGALDIEAEAINANEKLELLDNQKGILGLNIHYYEYLKNYIEKNQEMNQIVVPSSIGVEDPILTGLITKLIDYRTEYRAISKGTGTTNPYLVNLDKEIKLTTENLLENIKNILASSYNQLRALNADIYKVEMQLDKLPSDERKLLEIQRRFNLNDNLFKFLLEKKAEAGITKAANKADHSVVDQARSIGSIRIKPNENLVYNSALLVGLFFPILIIVIISFWNDKITSREEIERKIGVPVVGVVGHNRYDSNLVAIDHPKSAITEAFRSLRINLSYLNPATSNKIISVTSSISGEGKTFISKNLAGILALAGYRVVLIGADMRKPKIHKDFNLDNKTGLSTYLSNATSYASLLENTSLDSFKIIPSGPIPPNPNELLGLSKMRELIKQLSTDFDFVIIDTPPIGLVADAMLLMNQSDINLFIVRCNYTRLVMLEEFEQLNQVNNLENCALVINDYKSSVGHYKYSYGYKYGYKYGESYYEEEGDKPTWKKWLWRKK